MTDARARWALSFADLTLLLLGFFVLLQAGGDRYATTDGVRAAFGEPTALRPTSFAAATLFEPGEAVLRPDVQRRLAALGRGAKQVTVVSTGRDRAVRRFDGWELAAARAAAVARAVSAGGLAEDRITVKLAEGGEGRGQQLRVVRR